ncbi:MAG TPA: hypothetical protein VJR69_11425, partial [Nitrospira sp.]|nr:hypothetical protein [Nitrospira sp.]
MTAFMHPYIQTFLTILVLALGQSATSTWAIQMESSAEKQANFNQQALGGLFHRWTFDQQTPEDALSGFTQFVV